MEISGGNHASNPFPAFDSIAVNHRYILFPRPAYCFGQQVYIRAEPEPFHGIVVGMKRGKYTWKYTIARCCDTMNDAEEIEIDQSAIN